MNDLMVDGSGLSSTNQSRIHLYKRTKKLTFTILGDDNQEFPSGRESFFTLSSPLAHQHTYQHRHMTNSHHPWPSE